MGGWLTSMLNKRIIWVAGSEACLVCIGEVEVVDGEYDCCCIGFSEVPSYR